MSWPQKVMNTIRISGGMLLLAAALLLCFVPITAAQNGIVSENGITMCKDLKPFNNIDELLYQFYVNLDSDCLFTMPLEELEKIWDIKILSHERASGKEFSLIRESADFKNKPYKSERDAFFVETRYDRNTHSRAFDIVITREYGEAHATLFPDGNFPKLIPEPLSKLSPPPKIHWTPGSDHSLGGPINKGKYRMIDHTYYWLNAGKNRMIYLNGLAGIISISVIDGVLPGFTN